MIFGAPAMRVLRLELLSAELFAISAIFHAKEASKFTVVFLLTQQ